MSSAISLKPQAPISRRLLAWAGERFPPANGVLIAAVYLTALLASRALAGGPTIEDPALDVAGFAGVLAYFLMLRVFDEHKDFARDCRTHPDRVLQSGLVTLRHLKVVGGLCIATQLVASVLHDGGLGTVTLWWLVALAWSLLMLKEFFVGEWLSRRLVLYAVTHLLAMPLAILWIARMGAGDRPLPPSVLWVALLGGLLGAGFEVGRKLRSPEDERPEVDSYTQVLGTTGAAWALGTILTAHAAVATVVLAVVGAGSPVAYAALAVPAAAGLVAAARFAQAPTRERAGRTELVSAATLLAQLTVLVVALLVTRGLS